MNEGPERWVRAQRNAQAHPNSHGAKLYQKRHRIASMVASPLSANTAFTVSRRGHNAPPRRLHLCRPYCAAMQVQLENKDATEADVRRYLQTVLASHDPAVVLQSRWSGVYNTTLEKLNVPLLRRPVMCRVCGKTINAGQAPSSTPTTPTSKDRWYIAPNGQMFARAELREVELTIEEAVILGQYSTDDLRRRYAVDRGKRLD